MSGLSTEGRDGFLHVSAESKAPFDPEVEAKLRAEAAEIISRYPNKRSALLPMLHLVQSVDGYVAGRGVTLCAELLDLTEAEVSGVATFYTQYKRHANGEYTVGVCTNTLCAIMGGDAIWDTVSAHLGVGHDETTEDGKITLERIECNAACDFAPVVMANWEFFDNQTPESTVQLVDDLQAGRPVRPSRGPNELRTFKEVSRTLAGFPDGLAEQGPAAGPESLVGLEIAKEHGWHAPAATGDDADAPAPTDTTAGQPGDAGVTDEKAAELSDKAARGGAEPKPSGTQSSVDSPAKEQPGTNEKGE